MHRLYECIGHLRRVKPTLRLDYGVRMAELFKPSIASRLRQVLRNAGRYPVLEIGLHESLSYAEMKAKLAKRYLRNPSKKARPRWLENWVDEGTGKMLAIDENDLWMCAQAKEPQLTLATADIKMERISEVDPAIKLLFPREKDVTLY